MTNTERKIEALADGLNVLRSQLFFLVILNVFFLVGIWLCVNAHSSRITALEELHEVDH